MAETPGDRDSHVWRLLYRVAEAAATAEDLQAFYREVHAIVGELMDATNLFIALYDDERQRISFPYYVDEVDLDVPDPDLWEPFGVGNARGTTAYVLRTGKPQLLKAADMDRLIELGEIELVGAEAEDSEWLGVPLEASGRTVGVLVVQTYVEAVHYTEEDRDLLAYVGRHIGAALNRVRTLEEVRQRTAELETVNSVVRALAEQLELDALVQLVGEKMRETFEADIVYVGLVDRHSGRVEFPYFVERGEHMTQEPLEPGQGFTGQILDTKRPLLLNSRDEIRAAGEMLGTSCSSYLGVPILLGDEAIGVISVQDIDDEARFGPADEQLLSTLAANVGVAIHNARLYEAQREGEQQTRQLLEELPLAAYRDLPDISMTSVWASPRIEEIFGYPREAWQDPTFFESVLHPDDHWVIAKQAGILERNEDRWSSEYRIIAEDGRTVWVRDDAFISKDEQGKPMFVHGFLLDITEETLAQAEIRRQKQYFESLVEISPVAVVVMDPDERVTGWNPAATDLFGYSPEEAIGRLIDDLVFKEEGLEEGRDVTREAFDSGRAHRITRRWRKDGEAVDVQMMFVPLTVDGEHVGFYAIYHDISELQHARQEAEAATEAKSAFLAAMSHEIRTPMNAIIGMSGLLIDTELDDEQRDYASVVASSAESLLGIINDILDFSKIEAGRMDLEDAAFELRECVEGVMDTIGPLAAHKRLDLVYDIHESAPEVVIGDGARLRQILLNLLNNAVKFTEAGDVSLTVEGRPADGRVHLELTVRDTGIGIPADTIETLFDSFSQADVSTSRRYGGTGLGLAISRRLAELMGGTVWAESTGVAGEGSAFHVQISAGVAERQPDRPTVATPALNGRRLLVVDDNDTNRRLVVRHATAWGMQAVDASSGPNALEALEREGPFDAAVLDLMMPVMDGLELAAEIRRRVGVLPLVMLSSVGHEVRKDPRYARAGIDGHLMKPLKPAVLRAVLGELLGAPQEAEAPAARASDLPVALAEQYPLKILLAEDNLVNQKLALKLLERMGYAADVAGNGAEAVAAVEGDSYDLVLMDVQMPEMDGLEATQAIIERCGSDRPRIVALTADAMQDDRDRCLAAGMDDYLTKPIRPAELAEALERSAKPPQPALEAGALERLMETAGGDPEFVAVLIDTFADEAPGMLDELRGGMASSDGDSVRRAAHTLKSNAATFGATHFSELCAELEAYARDGNLAGATQMVGRIEDAYSAAQAELAKLREGLAGT